MGGEYDQGAALDWLTDLVRAGCGAVTISETENGNIGLWHALDADDETTPALGTGDTAEEAIEDAFLRTGGKV